MILVLPIANIVLVQSLHRHLLPTVSHLFILVMSQVTEGFMNTRSLSSCCFQMYWFPLYTICGPCLWAVKVFRRTWFWSGSLGRIAHLDIGRYGGTAVKDRKGGASMATIGLGASPTEQAYRKSLPEADGGFAFGGLLVRTTVQRPRYAGEHNSKVLHFR